MRSTLHCVAIAAVAGVIGFAIEEFGARRHPAAGDQICDRNTPGKISAGLAVAFATIFVAISGGVAISGEHGTGAIIIAIALPLGTFMMPSPTHCHDPRWDSEEMSAPIAWLGGAGADAGAHRVARRDDARHWRDGAYHPIRLPLAENFRPGNVLRRGEETR